MSFTLIGRHLSHIRIQSLMSGQAGLNCLKLSCVHASNLQFWLAGNWSSALSDFSSISINSHLVGDVSIGGCRGPEIIILATVPIARFCGNFCIRLIWLFGSDFDFICTFIQDLSFYLGCVCEKSYVYPLRLWLLRIYRFSRFVHWQNLWVC